MAKTPKKGTVVSGDTANVPKLEPVEMGEVVPMTHDVVLPAVPMTATEVEKLQASSLLQKAVTAFVHDTVDSSANGGSTVSDGLFMSDGAGGYVPILHDDNSAYTLTHLNDMAKLVMDAEATRAQMASQLDAMTQRVAELNAENVELVKLADSSMRIARDAKKEQAVDSMGLPSVFV